MIDPNDPLQFLERTHREFQGIAGEWHDGRTWTAREGQLLREDGMVMAECPLNAMAKLTASVLLAVNGSPHAVLRRIDRERQILELHKPTKGDAHDGGTTVCDTCANASREEVEGEPYPCATVRLLAECWGWTEEATP
ncbi:hypothetical protein ACFXKC_40755 [Streptomyces sp. NPDC059340]|uniref:hypothetical protein n=1 Tax=Streptomyces sp. NPDC059340 TaxID=3346806 RepID=UPI0036AFBA5E